MEFIYEIASLVKQNWNLILKTCSNGKGGKSGKMMHPATTYDDDLRSKEEYYQNQLPLM